MATNKAFPSLGPHFLGPGVWEPVGQMIRGSGEGVAWKVGLMLQLGFRPFIKSQTNLTTGFHSEFQRTSRTFFILPVVLSALVDPGHFKALRDLQPVSPGLGRLHRMP